MKRLILIAAVLACLLQAASAQQKPQFKPVYYQDTVSGKLFWNRSLPVYLRISPTPDGAGIRLESKVTAQYTNPFYFDTEGLNYIRTHWAVDTSTKQTVSPQIEIKFEVYADGKPPYTQIILTDPNKKYIAGRLLCGKDLDVSFKSSDAMSGVKDIYYSINGKDYQIYDTVIKIDKEGDYIVKYFAVDYVGNAEKTREKSFTVDFTPPQTKSIVTGIFLAKESIVSPNTKIYLETKDNIAGVKITYYRIDSMPWRVYQSRTTIPLSYLDDGEHVLQFYSIDNVNNKEPVQSFAFYLDKTAPICIADVLGDKFVVDGKVYFSGRTKMKLTSVDNKSGVKAVMYSVDGSEFKPYKDPFYLPSVPGWHTVRYFSLDSTENLTESKDSKYYEYRMKVDKIYMDLSGPDLSYSIQGEKFARNDTLFISPRTKIVLSGYDKESGLKYLAYNIDDNKMEIKYNGPFSLGEKAPGKHVITIIGYDNVNNRNKKTVELFLDSRPPEIYFMFGIKPLGTKDSLEIYPSYTKLFVSLVDDYTGIRKILYSLNSSQLLPYRNYIDGFRKGLNTVKVVAYDKVGNKTEKEIKFYVN